MKSLRLFASTVLMAATLVACNKDGGGGSQAVAPAATNSCANYTRDALGNYRDANGQIVNCSASTVGNSCANYVRDQWGRYYDPRTGMIVTCTNTVTTYPANCTPPRPGEGCEAWSRCTPGVQYIPMNWYGQLMCVPTNTFMSGSGYYMGQSFGVYPTSMCIPGYNCNSGCISGNFGNNSGNAVFGINVGFCF